MLHTLEWEYTPDYELLGVSSAVGCHRLAWSMNRVWMASEAATKMWSWAKAKRHPAPFHAYVDEEAGIALHLDFEPPSGRHVGQRARLWTSLVMVNHHELAAHEVIATLRELDEVAFVIAVGPGGMRCHGAPHVLFD